MLTPGLTVSFCGPSTLLNVGTTSRMARTYIKVMFPGFYPPPRMFTSIPWEGLLRARVPTFSHYVTQVYHQGRKIGCKWVYANGLVYRISCFCIKDFPGDTVYLVGTHISLN